VRGLKVRRRVVGHALRSEVETADGRVSEVFAGRLEGGKGTNEVGREGERGGEIELGEGSTGLKEEGSQRVELCVGVSVCCPSHTPRKRRTARFVCE
jgi:hypothetical protein